ncbi:MAG TPA: hypothetical protein VFP55_10855, partial [Solirubrobacteraceae bacterium]|nr:hypothetical protein [Solirubrobacteraceae bacterium]
MERDRSTYQQPTGGSISMRSFFTKKRSLVALVAVAALAIAGGAFAYFSSAGTGTGSATVGSSTPFDVGQNGATTGPPLVPEAQGGPNVDTIPYTVTNPSTGSQYLNQVIVSIPSTFSTQKDSSKPACTAHDFSIEGLPVGTAYTDTRL